MQAFIFDFDGVVVDSERHWGKVQDFYLQELIPDWPENAAGQFMGHGPRAVYDILVNEYGLKMTYEEYKTYSDTHVESIYGELAEPLPGLHNLLKRLEGIPLAIASSSRTAWIKKAVDRLNLAETFPVICTSDDVNDNAKPAPDVYLLAAERLGVDPTKCVAIEDTFHGSTAAKAAGMYCFGLRTDMNPSQDLSKADQVIHHFDELTEEVLKKL